MPKKWTNFFVALYCKLDQIFSSVSRGNGCPDVNLPPVARESEISCIGNIGPIYDSSSR